MTIASAFNEITVAQGGTASTTGSIAGAIDKLNDVLAGSDQEAASTIEQAVRLLGQHIGGGSSVTVEALTATENKTYTAPSGKAYSPVTVNVSGGATFGNLQFSPSFYTQAIAANTYMYPSDVLAYSVFGFGVDGDVISKIEDSTIPFMPALASGLDVVITFSYGELLPTIGNAYDVTLVQDGDDMKFATAEEINVTITQTTVDWYSESDEPIDAYMLTIPELDAGHYLFISAPSE